MIGRNHETHKTIDIIDSLENREVRLQQILHEAQRELYKDFCEGIADETHPSEALDAIGHRLDQLLKKSELAKHIETIYENDICICRKAKEAIGLVKNFYKEYEKGAHAYYTTKLSDILLCINKTERAIEHPKDIEQYINTSLKTLNREQSESILLIDTQTLIVFARHFIETYMHSKISDNSYHALDNMREHLLTNIQESNSFLAWQGSSLVQLLQETYGPDKVDRNTSHYDVLYVIFFMTLYRELIHKLHGLRRILDEFDDLSLDTHSKTGYKKKFAELKEEYDSTKDDYKKKYNLITPLHKLSGRYNRNIETMFSMICNHLSDSIESTMKHKKIKKPKK